MNVYFKTSIKCLIWTGLNIGVYALILHFGQQHFDNSNDQLDFLAIVLNIFFFILSCINFFSPFLAINNLRKNWDAEHLVILLFALANFAFVFIKCTLDWPYGSGTL